MKTISIFIFLVIFSLGYGQTPFQIDGLWGFEKNAKVIIEPKYDYVTHFQEGMAAVQFEFKWGFINTEGKVVIPLQFEKVQPFKDGVARVIGKAGMGLIDAKGKLLIDTRFEKIEKREWDDYYTATTTKGGKTFYKDGWKPIPPQYSSFTLKGDFLVADKTGFGMRGRLDLYCKNGLIATNQDKNLVENHIAIVEINLEMTDNVFDYSDGNEIESAPCLLESNNDNRGKFGIVSSEGEWIIKPENKFIFKLEVPQYKDLNIKGKEVNVYHYYAVFRKHNGDPDELTPWNQYAENSDFDVLTGGSLSPIMKNMDGLWVEKHEGEWKDDYAYSFYKGKRKGTISEKGFFTPPNYISVTKHEDYTLAVKENESVLVTPLGDSTIRANKIEFLTKTILVEEEFDEWGDLINANGVEQKTKLPFALVTNKDHSYIYSLFKGAQVSPKLPLDVKITIELDQSGEWDVMHHVYYKTKGGKLGYYASNTDTPTEAIYDSVVPSNVTSNIFGFINGKKVFIDFQNKTNVNWLQKDELYEYEELVEPTFVDDFMEHAKYIYKGKSGFITKNNGLYGLATASGWTVEEKYDTIYLHDTHRNVFVTKKDNKYGFIDQGREKNLEPIFMAVNEIIQEGELMVVKTKLFPKFSYIDFDGHKHMSLNDDLQLVKVGKYYGIEIYDDGDEETHTFTVEPQFKELQFTEFYDTYIAKGKNKLWGVISGYGDTLIPFLFKEIDANYFFNFDNIIIELSPMKVRKKKTWGAYSAETGNEIIPDGFTSLEDCYDCDDKHLIFVNLKNSVGLVNENCDVVIPCEYKTLEFSYEHGTPGFITTLANGKVGLVNCEGLEVIKPIYDRFISNEEDGFDFYSPSQVKTVQNELIGMLDLATGNSMPCAFDEVDEFLIDGEGELLVYGVRKGNLYGVYDQALNEIFPCEFSKIRNCYLSNSSFDIAYAQKGNEFFFRPITRDNGSRDLLAPHNPNLNMHFVQDSIGYRVENGMISKYDLFSLVKLEEVKEADFSIEIVKKKGRVYCKSGKFGVKNSDDKVIVEPLYKNIILHNTGFFQLCEKEEHTLVDLETGELIID